jgi:long-chain acyl-CoA synthetase
MVYGDNKPFNVALVVANVDAVKSWGAENGVSESDKDKLLANPKVKALFKKELDKYCEKFKGFEEVRDFALVHEDFTTENEMLTPSLKVKRRAVLAKWGSLLDSLYTKKKEKADAAPEKAEKADKKKAEANAE